MHTYIYMSYSLNMLCGLHYMDTSTGGKIRETCQGVYIPSPCVTYVSKSMHVAVSWEEEDHKGSDRRQTGCIAICCPQ